MATTPRTAAKPNPGLLSAQAIRANAAQFRQQVDQFQTGLQDFHTKASQLQANIAEERQRLQTALLTLHSLAPLPHHPAPNHQRTESDHAHAAALAAFFSQGERLWYHVSTGLVGLLTLVLGQALLHPFEPYLQAWITHSLKHPL